MTKLIIALLFLVSFGWAQTPHRIVEGGTFKERQIGAAGKPYNSTLTVATVAPAALTAVATKVQLIHCVNYTDAVQTVTITDGNDQDYVSQVSMAARSVMVIHYGPVGLSFADGVKLAASAETSIKCQVEGVQ